MKSACLLQLIILFILSSCNNRLEERSIDLQKFIFLADSAIDKIAMKEVIIEKELLYDKYTLPDVYPYRDTIRSFQWEKIHNYLTIMNFIQEPSASWGILQNRKNKNGIAPLVHTYQRNTYNNIADTFGIERYQGIPLYLASDTVTPERYALDGSLVKLIKGNTNFTKVNPVHYIGDWLVPKKYIKYLNDSIVFDKVIFVDRTNQNIMTLENVGPKWLVRSMNPATTGVHKPPFMKETPLGVFVLQEKKIKMVYLEDNSTETGGFSPYANRFCNGGYIHGIPVNVPGTIPIEISPTLGTTPRSHMCVRTATSHSKFIYNWALINKTIIVIID